MNANEVVELADMLLVAARYARGLTYEDMRTCVVFDGGDLVCELRCTRGVTTTNYTARVSFSDVCNLALDFAPRFASFARAFVDSVAESEAHATLSGEMPEPKLEISFGPIDKG